MYVNLRRHIAFQDTVDFRGDFAGYGARYPAVQVNLTTCGGSLRQRRIFDIKSWSVSLPFVSVLSKDERGTGASHPPLRVCLGLRGFLRLGLSGRTENLGQHSLHLRVRSGVHGNTAPPRSFTAR